MTIEYSKGTFIVNPETQVDENGNPTTEQALHAQMLADFEDETKKQQFIDLLEADPNTAFKIYHNL